jgi:hypothetical protein
MKLSILHQKKQKNLSSMNKSNNYNFIFNINSFYKLKAELNEQEIQ